MTSITVVAATSVGLIMAVNAKIRIWSKGPRSSPGGGRRASSERGERGRASPQRGDAARGAGADAGSMPTPPAQLIVYAFGPDARFEGQLVGALERIESGGAVRVLRALLVGRDPETGDLVAFEQEGNGAGGFVSSALSFRLDSGERERATQRALDGPAGDAVRAMGDKLEPGGTLAAIFV